LKENEIIVSCVIKTSNHILSIKIHLRELYVCTCNYSYLNKFPTWLF